MEPGTIHARQSGAGPDLLLVHGFPVDGSMWDPAAEILADAFRVITPDLRGFGSSPPSPATTMTTYADDLAALLDALGIERPALVAGLSFGGYVVMEFLRRHGDRVDAIGLINTRETADTPEAAAGRRRLAERLDQGETVSIVAEPMLPKMASPKVSAGFVEHWRGVMCSQSPAGVAAALRAIAARPDSAATLRDFRGRALVVAGDEDAITPVSDHERMSGMLSDAELHVIAGAGHMAPTERPEEFARIVRGFLETQRPTPSPLPIV